MTEDSMKAHGYTIRFRMRSQKKRKRVNGRARGFYEGDYVYLRVVGPDQVTRDLYLGTTTRSRQAIAPKPGEKRQLGREDLARPPATSAGGRKKGGKARDLTYVELRAEVERRGYSMQVDD